MKITLKKYSIVAISAGVCLFFACNNSSDYKSDSDSSSISKESAIAAQSNVDTAAMDNGGSTAPAVTDTSAVHADSTTGNSVSNKSKIVKAKPNPAKKGHKGMVRMAVHRPDYTARIAEDKNGIYNYAEVRPVFPGGEKELDKFIQDNIVYPEDAKDNGVEGTVTVTFAVDENGKVYAPKLKDEKLGYGLDEEALNAITKMPRWTPGRIKGKNVKSYYDLPITFALQD